MKQAKEIHIVIRNGLVESVYSDEPVEVYVYDLDSTDYEYQDVMEKEVEQLDNKYTDIGCTYIEGQDLEEE